MPLVIPCVPKEKNEVTLVSNEAKGSLNLYKNLPIDMFPAWHDQCKWRMSTCCSKFFLFFYLSVNAIQYTVYGHKKKNQNKQLNASYTP